MEPHSMALFVLVSFSGYVC